jgi:hypothetical protein
MTTEAANLAEATMKDSNVRKPLSWSDFVAARQHAALIASQRPTPIASPAQTVFTTWELCENILRNLPCMALEQIRGLNSTCNAIVSRSRSLQQTRYLEPRPVVFARATSASPALTQLLIELNASSYELIIIELQPILKDKGDIYSRFSWNIHGPPGSRSLAKASMGIEFRDIHRLAAISPRASLNDMFLSQPPVHKMRITIEGHLKRKHRFRPFKCVEVIALDNERGITFGQVFDKIGQSIRRHYNARVGLMTINL